MNELLEKIQEIRIVPVIALDNVNSAAPLAEALCEGGIPCAEVTFRTDAAEEAIHIMASQYPQMLVGAGTVLTTEQACRAVGAGAKFIVSPGLDLDVVKYCLEKNIPFFPGCATPTEIIKAKKAGISVIKFFPAELYGGIRALKTFAEVFPDIKIMPTGGINLDNMAEYLKCSNVCACGGSFIVNKELLNKHDFNAIKELAKEAKKCTVC